MITIDIRDTVSPMLKSALAGLEDLSVPLRQSGLYMQKSFVKQFQAQGKPTWTPLSKATIARRRKGKGSGTAQILQDTGRLRRSYVSRGRNSIWTLTKYQLEMGSNLAYAAIHQFGGSVTRKVSPGVVRLRRLRNNQVRFASRKHKNTWNVSYKGGGSYTINVPARPLAFQPEDSVAIGKIFNDYITDSMNKA